MLADRRVAGQVALGLPVQLQRLPVGREGRGLAGGGQGVPVGRLGQPGQVEPGRDEGVAVAAPGERVADEGVAEVEAGLVRARLDQVPLLEAAQAVVDGVRGQPADGDQQVELEGPADHRARPGHRQRGLVQPPGPGQHGVGQGVGHGNGRHPAGVGPGCRLGQGGQQLLDVQGDAVAAVVDGGRHPGRRRMAEQGAGQGRRLGRVEPGQADLLGQPLGQQPGPPGARPPRG